LSEAASKRQDDLRAKDKEISDSKHLHMKELTSLRADHELLVGTLREEHQSKIQHAEADRLNSIRQVDREEVAKTAAAANTAIMTLAKTNHRPAADAGQAGDRYRSRTGSS
jgi:hypothetical protein